MPAINNIAEEILDYLFKHPEAGDTLEGITEWWLMYQRITTEMEKVKAAIFKLVREGWVTEIKSKNSIVRYRLNPKKPKATKPYI